MERLPGVRLAVVSEQDYKAAIELFMLRCRSQNLSPRSVEWYSMVLSRLAAFMAGVPDNPLPRNTRPHHVQAWLVRMQESGRAPGSVKRFFVGVKTFFNYLEQERVITQSPTKLMKAPKTQRVLLRGISQEEVEALLSQPDTKSFVGLRDWAMILLALDTGLRISEILSVKVADVDWGNSSISVLGKGSKMRTVFFGTSVKRALWDFKARRGLIPGMDHLFVNQFGQTVGKRWMQQSLVRYGRRAGIQRPVTPHVLRRTFATTCLVRGGDAVSLADLMGYSSLEMIKHYARLANRDLAELHRRYSPVDGWAEIP